MNNHFFINSEEVIDYFIELLDVIRDNPTRYRDLSNHCLSPNCFASNNLLSSTDKLFLKNIDIILSECQKYIPKKVEYFYLHMIDYCDGGDMLIHKHDHNEDYSFVLYLNTCEDGYTTLYLEQPIRIKPERGKVLVFSSDVYHSATFSKRKKILVGGLKVSQ